MKLIHRLSHMSPRWGLGFVGIRCFYIHTAPLGLIKQDLRTPIVVARFIGRWERCPAAMNRRRYQDYCAIVLAQPARRVARPFLVFALTVYGERYKYVDVYQ